MCPPLFAPQSSRAVRAVTQADRPTLAAFPAGGTFHSARQPGRGSCAPPPDRVPERLGRALVRSANNTVTCLCAPWRALRTARICSARCFGVYDSSTLGPDVAAEMPQAMPHLPQNFTPHSLEKPQPGPVRASGIWAQNRRPALLGVPQLDTSSLALTSADRSHPEVEGPTCGAPAPPHFFRLAGSAPLGICRSIAIRDGQTRCGESTPDRAHAHGPLRAARRSVPAIGIFPTC